MKIVVCKGIPASGKSTWAKQFVLDNPGYVRVNRDDLRNMRGKYWIPDQEGFITDCEISCVTNALKNNLNVVLDATNFNEHNLNALKRRVEVWGEEYFNGYFSVEWEEKIFDTPLEECIRRDNFRAEGKVGEEVIRNFYNKYIIK
jgi:predicted kinase